MQLFGTDERHLDQPSGSIFYTGNFTWEKPDGSRESINVPGRYDVPAGTTMVLLTQLPSDFSATSLAIRSSLQDIRFYIDGVLRVEYSTGGTRLSGKTSASRYVFCPTSAADAGKELRIELTTWAHQYSGVVNDIYCGACISKPYLFDAKFVLKEGENRIRVEVIANMAYKERDEFSKYFPLPPSGILGPVELWEITNS